MGALKNKLKHAFAVDPPGVADPTPQQQVPVDWICREIARRRLTTPAIAFLEMSRPLNYVGAQLGHVMAPGIWALARQLTYANYKHFLAFLELRGSMEYFCQRIEHFEEEFERQKSEKPPTPTESDDRPDDPQGGP